MTINKTSVVALQRKGILTRDVWTVGCPHPEITAFYSGISILLYFGIYLSVQYAVYPSTCFDLTPQILQSLAQSLSTGSEWVVRRALDKVSEGRTKGLLDLLQFLHPPIPPIRITQARLAL